ncbi:hypothetical protein B0T24DRAFT_602224 [Lasiosphaeria ovina]|uniref:Fungal N-terminal domain-containing protein n=1 Tax=Lasiosphaeria ovina TaxID=92902 RepID=A0AAE0TX46_9PEZI|nr:hypothetical protein B0T24DRAFT_602224 [Lasiosphaeria ovina]
MDPLSMVASIGPICGTTVKLITTISDFVDSVQDAPKEVQALNTQLASLYACLGNTKVAIQEPRISGIPDTWKAAFEKLAEDCSATLDAVVKIVEKAKITETASSGSQIVRSIRFTFKSKQVAVLRTRLGNHAGLLTSLLATLNESRGRHFENRLEDIHSMIGELLSARREFKETIGILAQDDGEEADVIILDRRKRRGDSSEASASQHGDSPATAPDGLPSEQLDPQDLVLSFSQLVSGLNLPDRLRDRLVEAHGNEVAAAESDAGRRALEEAEEAMEAMAKLIRNQEAEVARLEAECRDARREAVAMRAESESKDARTAAIESALLAAQEIQQERLDRTRAELESLRASHAEAEAAYLAAQGLQQEELDRTIADMASLLTVHEETSARLSEFRRANELSASEEQAISTARSATWTVRSLQLRASKATVGSNNIPTLPYSDIPISLRINRVVWIEQASRPPMYMSTWFTRRYKTSREGSKVSIEGPYRAALGAYGKSQYDCHIEFTNAEEAAHFDTVFSNALNACDKIWLRHVEKLSKVDASIDVSSAAHQWDMVDGESAKYIWMEGILGRHGFGDYLISDFSLLRRTLGLGPRGSR